MRFSDGVRVFVPPIEPHLSPYTTSIRLAYLPDDELAQRAALLSAA